MPKVHTVQRARKAIPSAGIRKGDSYYWWKFRYGPKRVSKTYPKPSQLTQSEFLSSMYDLQERIDQLDPESYVDDPESLRSELEDIAAEIRGLGEEQASKRDNMPEQLQDSDVGVLLEERADGCESWADELESIDPDLPDHDDFVEEATDEYCDELDILGDDGKPTRELTAEETKELEDRIDEKWREQCREALSEAIDAAKSADPGIG